jgi:translation initiation factor 1
MSPSDDAPKKGLTHNPFAKLRPDGKPAPREPAPAGSKTPPPAPVPSKGRVIVRREKKGHGGKTVTIAEGEGLTAAVLPALERDAKKALGTGARIEDGALVVQGDLADRLVKWLTERGFGPVTRGN